MFRGESKHSVDAKGRLILPLKFREALNEGFVVTKGLDKCLYVYPMKDWVEFEQKVQKLPVTDEDVRKFVRFFIGSAADGEFDGNGRTLLPQNLREYAGILKEVVSVGAINHIEIWSSENWDTYIANDNVIDKKLASKMAELGI